MAEDKTSKNEDGVYITELSNGFSIITDQKKTLQTMVVLRIKAGSAEEEKPGKQETAAHLNEHVNLAESDLWKTQDERTRLVNKMHGTSNANTNNDYTRYFIKASNGEVGNAIKMLGAMVKSDSFSQKRLDEEKKAIFNELDVRKSTPWLNSYDITRGITFAGSPLEIPPIGSREAIESITPDAAKSFKK
jgi:zinc protease